MVTAINALMVAYKQIACVLLLLHLAESFQSGQKSDRQYERLPVLPLTFRAMPLAQLNKHITRF